MKAIGRSGLVAEIRCDEAICSFSDSARIAVAQHIYDPSPDRLIVVVEQEEPDEGMRQMSVIRVGALVLIGDTLELAADQVHPGIGVDEADVGPIALAPLDDPRRRRVRNEDHGVRVLIPARDRKTERC